MTQKNKATLKSDLNSSYPDNTSKQITPQAVRTQQVNTIDSAANLKETALQTMDGPLESPQYTQGGNDIKPANELMINSVADLPTPSDNGDGRGNGYRFTSGQAPVLGASISISLPIIPPNDSASFFMNASGSPSLVYTGTGALIRTGGAGASPLHQSRFKNIDFIGTGTNSFSDCSAGGLTILECAIIGFDNLLTSSNATLIIFDNVTAINNGGGFVVADTGLTFLNQVNAQNASTISGTFFDFSGTCVTVLISTCGFNPRAGDDTFDIDSGIVNTFFDVSNSNFTTIGGDSFASGSLDQTDPRFDFAQVRGVPNSTSFAYLNALDQAAVETTLSSSNVAQRINATFTDTAERFTTDASGNIDYIGVDDIRIGVTGSISGTVVSGINIPMNFYIAKGNTLNTIASFADAGGGQITVTTSLAHGYSNGDRIIIEDTTSYNSEYTIANVASTTFEITETFVATETGSHYKLLTFSKASNEYSQQSKNTSLITETPLSTSDRIFATVENGSTSSNWATNDIQLRISKQ